MPSFESIQKRLQERYPTLHIRWNQENKTCELWENHGNMSINRGWRKLWTYENHDGTHLPVIFDTILSWALKADTRHWGDRNIFREIMKSREDFEIQRKKDLENKLGARIGEDFNYIAGIKTFFMDPKSMPVSTSKIAPGHE